MSNCDRQVVASTFIYLHGYICNKIIFNKNLIKQIFQII